MAATLEVTYTAESTVSLPTTRTAVKITTMFQICG